MYVNLYEELMNWALGQKGDRFQNLQTKMHFDWCQRTFFFKGRGGHIHVNSPKVTFTLTDVSFQVPEGIISETHKESLVRS